MTLKKLFEDSVQKLTPVSPTPRLDVEILIEDVFGIKPIQLITEPALELDVNLLLKFSKYLERRFDQEPIAYILGYKDFYKYQFIVNSSVLIPRPETEFIVEKCAEYVDSSDKPLLRVLDLGAGSGCIGLSLVLDHHHAHLTSVEISKEACSVIYSNIDKYQVSDRVQLVNTAVEDLDLAEKKFDIIVTNPPYIPYGDEAVGESVRLYEPSLALYAEDEGYALIKSWTNKIKKHLASEAIYLIEVGHDQSEPTRDFLLQLKIFDKVEIIKDYQGFGRIVYGVRGN